MNRPETLKLLEFPRVLHAISEYAHSPATREAISNITPMSERLPISERHALIDEVRRVSDRGAPLGLGSFEDIRPLLDRLRPVGSVLEPMELLAVLSALWAMEHTFEDYKPDESTPRLASIAERLTGFPALRRTITRTVGGEGEILDSASITLRELRVRLRALQKKITRRLEEIVRDADYTPFIQDDFITTRSGRWVIPVRMDAKGQVKGVVHDVSRTGETAFVEPLEIIGLSNELENLSAEEKAEVIRILKAISKSLREALPEIEPQFGELVHIDMIASIAALAQRLRMTSPELNAEGRLKLSGARHPLLMMLLGREVVPLDLELSEEAGGRALVITGPNAGGKTIAIKAAGLLTLMALSGMPVPGGDGSSYPVLEGVLADIGDEQSIEASLSTFAGHIGNLARILNAAGPSTLVLMDELGTGTDPAEGAALGCAIMRELLRRGAMVLVTTHLVDIVGFVERESGMRNASMEFDPERHVPLYRLKLGEPGQSYALEAAARYGLPAHIVDEARELMGPIRAEFQSLVSDMKRKRMAYEEELRKAETLRVQAERDRAALSERLARIEHERKLAVKNALEEARELIAKASREAHEILEEVRREKKRAPLKALEAARADIDKKIDAIEPENRSLKIDSLKAGDAVFVKSIGADAAVLRVNRSQGRVTIKHGNKELELPASYLSPPRGAPRQAEVSAPVEEAAPREIKLIGRRVDEALELLEAFLNRASLAGVEEVRVIHGIGTGALRRAVQEFLSSHPAVEGFRPGEREEGGAGATVAKLR